MDDFLITNLRPFLQMTKSKARQEEAIKRMEALAFFLQRNGLCTRTLIDGDHLEDMNFRIMKSDLTDEGFEFVKKGLDKWDAGLDRGKPNTDVSLLEKHLKKMRSK